jgi:hypothetical protein
MNELRRTFPHGLPPGARLFLVDAIGMYSNIDTDHGIDFLTQWLRYASTAKTSQHLCQWTS